jgi:PPM family protein phosphatase
MTDNNFVIVSAAVSDRGLSEKRPQNEDSYLEMPGLGLFAVADGVGGAQAGDVASQMAMEILGEAFANLQRGGDPEEMMRVAIERANNAIYQMSTDLPQLSTMATTIVALQLTGNIATIGHVGDSRLYRLDGRGSLYRETQDHSVVEEEVRAGRMTAAQAANHPSRNVISRALGAEGAVEVDMKTIMFEANSVFLLCSDGITRHITDFELRELLMSPADPSEVCRQMKEICYSRGAEDNLTAVIVKAVGAGAAVETPVEPAAAAFEPEEATVAAARPAAPVSAYAPAADDEDDEIPTRNLQMPPAAAPPEPYQREEQAMPAAEVPIDADTDEQFLMEEPAAQEPEPIAETYEPAPAAENYEPAPAAAYAAAAPATPAQAPARQEPVRAGNDFRIYHDYAEDEKKGGGLGKILSSLLLLLLGAVAGFGAYYLWQQANPPQLSEVPKLAPQSNDISFATFEKLRREVDADPSVFIANAEKNPPRDSADLYLIGRAHLLKREYEDAKKAFIEARNQLKDFPEPVNRRNLENDITMGLTIVQDKTAQTAFEREMKFLTGGDGPGTPISNSALNANGGGTLSNN